MLTSEQQSILSVVEDGHNVFITGQAGSGKSFLVKKIFQRLSSQNKCVALVCASGIACSVYSSEASASTVHTHYGLFTAEMSWKLVVDRALARNNVKERIKKANVIIWDECSMSSARILELVNSLHHHIAEGNERVKPFGGKQMVLVGEFLQLRPVPSCIDEGKMMYLSRVFISSIPHRYELKEILRQDESEGDFMKVLKEVRTGLCSASTEEFMVNLARPLPEQLLEVSIHIYFKKLAVQLHNQEKITNLPGQVLTLVAEDNNIGKNFKCPVEQVLQLKPGCRVMHLWNRNDKLKNGTIGFVERINANGNIMVAFKGIGTVEVKKETWYSMDRNGEIIGSRRQYPLSLAYAITCHKSQGLTLPSVIVHCSKEFVPGLIYVAITRVKSQDHLQVLNFQKRQLSKPSIESVEICNTHSIPRINDYDCCRDKVLNMSQFQVHDRNDELTDSDEDGVYDAMVEETCVQNYFERGEPDRMDIDLDTVYAVLSDDSPTGDSLRIPSPDFKYCDVLEKCRVPNPKAYFAEQKNKVVDHMLTL